MVGRSNFDHLLAGAARIIETLGLDMHLGSRMCTASVGQLKTDHSKQERSQTVVGKAVTFAAPGSMLGQQ